MLIFQCSPERLSLFSSLHKYSDDSWFEDKTERKERKNKSGVREKRHEPVLYPAETLKEVWCPFECFLEVIELIETTFFLQANSMAILKRNILWGKSKALDGEPTFVPFSHSLSIFSSVIFYSLQICVSLLFLLN